MPDSRAVTLASSLRTLGIANARVLEAIAHTPRERFVEEPFAHSAYENTALPIACGQTISQPYVVAYMTEALEVGPAMRVLEIGTGSGYQAAVLSHLCRRVYTIERHRPLFETAQARFKSLKLDNITTRYGDGSVGWPEQAPFDRILLTAATAEVPAILTEQLRPGGILVAPIGPISAEIGENSIESFSQQLTKMIRTETGVKREALIPVVFVPMVAGLPESGRKPDGSERNK